MHCWMNTQEDHYSAVLIECQCHSKPEWVRIVLFAKDSNGIKQWAGDAWVIGEEAVAICQSAIVGDCPGGILADWLEEHPECLSECTRGRMVVAADLYYWLRQAVTTLTVQ